jgi:hypothetical protein
MEEHNLVFLHSSHADIMAWDANNVMYKGYNDELIRYNDNHITIRYHGQLHRRKFDKYLLDQTNKFVIVYKGRSAFSAAYEVIEVVVGRDNGNRPVMECKVRLLKDTFVRRPAKRGKNKLTGIMTRDKLYRHLGVHRMHNRDDGIVPSFVPGGVEEFLQQYR